MTTIVHFKYILVFVLVTTLRVLSIAAPDWTVNSSGFSNSMTLTGVVKIDNEESLDENDKVAAFVNGECRGVVSLTYIASEDRYFAFLLVYSNKTSGEEITFKVYDADKDAMVDLSNKRNFVVDEIRGSVAEPYVFFNTIPESKIKSFSFLGINSPSSISDEEKKVLVQVPLSVNVSSLIAKFELSDGAIAYVNSKEQISEITGNDFTTTLNYVVTAADGSKETWTVIVEKNSTVGIKEEEIYNYISIYPIPAKERICLKFSEEASEEYVVTIYNAQGKDMMGDLTISNGENTLNVSSLLPGTYLMKLVTRKGECHKLFIKD